MRPIKFRVWDKFNKQMISDTHEYRHYGIDFGMDGCWRCGKSDAGGDYWHTIGPEEGAVLMQYTGLQDKNGKEIYEGDIVSDGTHFYKISWISTEDNQNFNGWIALPVSSFDGRVRFDLVEVVGNIYDNPELLEKK